MAGSVMLKEEGDMLHACIYGVGENIITCTTLPQGLQADATKRGVLYTFFCVTQQGTTDSNNVLFSSFICELLRDSGSLPCAKASNAHGKDLTANRS